MRTFFIFSLPHSRTAWLTNFMTHGNAHCFHEALISCHRVSDLKPIFEGTKKPIVGNADCLNALVADDIMAAFPESRLVVVERNPDKVEQSLSALGSWNPDMVRWMRNELEQVKAKYAPLIMPYEALSTPEGCKLVWNYCIGDFSDGTSFDHRRWEMLDALNVQIDLEKHTRKVARYRDSLDYLLRDYYPWRWKELAAVYLRPQHELPSREVPCESEAMRQWLDRLGMTENQYRALTDTGLNDFVAINPTCPLREWVGGVLELVHERRGA